MLETTRLYYDQLVRQSKRGVLLAYVSFHSGVRVEGAGIYPEDSFIDSTTYPTIVDRGAALMTPGDFKEGDRRTNSTLISRTGNLEQSSIQLEFDNKDSKFSKICGIEVPLNVTVELQHGTPELAQADWRSMFTGKIVEIIELSRGKFVVEVRAQ